MGMKLEEVQPHHLGTCKKVEIDKNDTVVLDGAGDKDAIQERCDLIKHSIETTKSDYEREKLQERLAKLSGGVAVIRVGGASEVEVAEKKDRVVDALNATRAAVEDGIVPGGGRALLHCSTQLDDAFAKCENMDQRIGVEIVQRALKAPLTTIVKNAGEEGAFVVGKLLAEADAAVGYNAQTDAYVDMYDAGIIDPAKVVKTAITDAQSVAALMMTAEALVADLPADPADAAAAAAMGGGGMGGMPGMGGMM